MPPLSQRWKNVLLDYISLFLASTFIDVIYTYILFFTHCLTKMYYYKPTIILETRKATQIFYETILKLNDLPEAIVSDQGLQFISEFWKHLTNQLSIDSKLSTFFYLEMDRLTEWANVVME